MSFSVVCLCMDESCFTGHFGTEPPSYPNILEIFILHSDKEPTFH